MALVVPNVAVGDASSSMDASSSFAIISPRRRVESDYTPPPASLHPATPSDVHDQFLDDLKDAMTMLVVHMVRAAAVWCAAMATAHGCNVPVRCNDCELTTLTGLVRGLRCVVCQLPLASCALKDFDHHCSKVRRCWCVGRWTMGVSARVHVATSMAWRC